MRRFPALETWRAELARGERTRTTFDAVWRAACAEANAAEAFSAGVPGLAGDFLADARSIIRKAAAEQQRAHGTAA